MIKTNKLYDIIVEEEASVTNYFSYAKIDELLTQETIGDTSEVLGDIFYPKGKLTAEVELIDDGFIEESSCVYTYRMTHPDIVGFELIYSILLAHSNNCNNGYMFPETIDSEGINIIGFNAGELKVKCLTTGKTINDREILLNGLVCIFYDDYQDVFLSASEPCTACETDEDGRAQAEEWSNRYDYS